MHFFKFIHLSNKTTRALLAVTKMLKSMFQKSELRNKWVMSWWFNIQSVTNTHHYFDSKKKNHFPIDDY